MSATGYLVRSAVSTVLTVGTCDTKGNIKLGVASTLSGALPIVFDDAVANANANMRANRASPLINSFIDNTKLGIINLATDSQTTGSLGVTGNWATCVGGDMPSINQDWAGGGGYRPNARGVAAWCFGYAVFADGEGCFATGRSVVAGREPTDPMGHKRYAVCMGASSYAQGECATSIGGNNSAGGDNSTCLGFGSTSAGFGAIAIGFSCTASGPGSCGIAGGQSSGTASFALGACTVTSDYGFAQGYGCNTSANFGVTQGYNCTATAVLSRAVGREAAAIRYGQYAASGGMFAVAGDSQSSTYWVHGTSTNGVGSILGDSNGQSLTLENGKMYLVTAKTAMGRTGTADRSARIHTLLLHCSAGTAVIDGDDDNSTAAMINGTAWTVAYTASGTEIRCTVTGTVAQTVRGLTTYEWSEIGGLT